MLSIRDVSYRYGSFHALDGVSFTLRPGVTALLGPNGAGKSTLLRLLSTLEPTTSGDITWNGESLSRRSNVRAFRRVVGVLPQHFGFIPSMRVAEQLVYFAWLRQIPRSQAQVFVREALETVGLAGRARDRMKNLSGGMQQRVGIAGAIMGNPDVIILDEPTVGLDVAQRRHFRSIVKAAGRQAIVVLSTHIVDDVHDCADRIVALNEGAVKFDGATSELMHMDEPGATHSHDPIRRLEGNYLRVLANSTAQSVTS